MVNMDQMALIPIDDFSTSLRKHKYQPDKVQLFCQSITEIEELRADQVQRLQKVLNVDKLPKSIRLSDPDLLPFLSPRVRAVVIAFPLQAEDIAKKYGLDSDEFNKMLRETRSNPVLRWKIIRKMKQAARSADNKRSSKEKSS